MPYKPMEQGFELMQAIADFIEFVRDVEDGEILRLEVRHGLPVSMETSHPPRP